MQVNKLHVAAVGEDVSVQKFVEPMDGRKSLEDHYILGIKRCCREEEKGFQKRKGGPEKGSQNPSPGLRPVHFSHESAMEKITGNRRQ